MKQETGTQNVHPTLIGREEVILRRLEVIRQGDVTAILRHVHEGNADKAPMVEGLSWNFDLEHLCEVTRVSD